MNPTYEKHGSIEFLDLTITHKQLEVGRYRKPTSTDTTLNFHPIEHKMAAFRFHITQMPAPISR
jgi:hypothetical protein